MWQDQTNAESASQRAKRARDGRILRLWMESAGLDRCANALASGHEGGADPGVRRKVVGAPFGTGTKQSRNPCTDYDDCDRSRVFRWRRLVSGASDGSDLCDRWQSEYVGGTGCA